MRFRHYKKILLGQTPRCSTLNAQCSTLNAQRSTLNAQRSMLYALMIKIIRERINIEEILRSINDPSAGGIDLFIGTTRDHSIGREVLSLEYEAYEPMALKVMNEIVEEAKLRWEVKKVAVVHRVGEVPVGEASVVVAVSSAHRSEAFDACRYVIDSLKKKVPIWKKERFTDGETWVGAQEL